MKKAVVSNNIRSEIGMHDFGKLSTFKVEI